MLALFWLLGISEGIESLKAISSSRLVRWVRQQLTSAYDTNEWCPVIAKRGERWNCGIPVMTLLWGEYKGKKEKKKWKMKSTYSTPRRRRRRRRRQLFQVNFNSWIYFISLYVKEEKKDARRVSGTFRFPKHNGNSSFLSPRRELSFTRKTLFSSWEQRTFHSEDISGFGCANLLPHPPPSHLTHTL